MTDLNYAAEIDSAARTLWVNLIIDRVVNFINQREQGKVNDLIDDHRQLVGNPGEVWVRFRDTVFKHSKWAPPPVPKGARARIPALHIDLFDRGNKTYLLLKKLEHDKVMMRQLLNLLTAKAKTMQEFRDALPFSVDPHATPLSDGARIQTDYMFLITDEQQRKQVGELKNMFAVYGMAELMGQ